MAAAGRMPMSARPGLNSADMTLRDHFAAAALTGLIINPELETYVRDGELSISRRLAIVAYGLADAMLAERGHGQG